MEKRTLTSDEKERLAFRADMLTTLCSIGDLLDDLYEIMHTHPDEREEYYKKDVCNALGDRMNSNHPFFVRYLQEARKLPDDEELFFAGLLKLSDKVAKLTP